MWEVQQGHLEHHLLKKYPLQWCHHERDGVSNHRRLDCLLTRLFRRRSKKTSNLRVTGLCEGNSTVTSEFPSQRASNAENASIWWLNHAIISSFFNNSSSSIVIITIVIINTIAVVAMLYSFAYHDGISYKFEWYFMISVYNLKANKTATLCVFNSFEASSRIWVSRSILMCFYISCLILPLYFVYLMKSSILTHPTRNTLSRFWIF